MIAAIIRWSSRNTVLARHALAALPPTPATGTWITYARCHDDIGWAIDDRDAAEVGLSGHDHRRFLSDWYAEPDRARDGREQDRRAERRAGDAQQPGEATPAGRLVRGRGRDLWRAPPRHTARRPRE